MSKYVKICDNCGHVNEAIATNCQSCGNDIEFLDATLQALEKVVSRASSNDRKMFRRCRACGEKVYFKDDIEFIDTCPECGDPDIMSASIEYEGNETTTPSPAQVQTHLKLKLIELTTKHEIAVPSEGGILGKEGTIDSEFMKRFRYVSRSHCEFIFRDDSWYIKDLNSTNATFLDLGTKLQPLVEVELYNNAILRVADVKFQVVIE